MDASLTVGCRLLKSNRRRAKGKLAFLKHLKFNGISLLNCKIDKSNKNKSWP